MSKKFQFHSVGGPRIPLRDDKESQILLQKWGLDVGMRTITYSFDQHFQPYEIEDFLIDLFNDEIVCSSFKVSLSRDDWQSPFALESCRPERKAGSIKYKLLNVTKTSMSFFDKIKTPNNPKVIRETGAICKCFPEYVNEIVCNDELWKMLIWEDSENYDIFSEDDRNEILFKIMQHIVIGGKLN
eukprot:UC4_evm1s1089